MLDIGVSQITHSLLFYIVAIIRWIIPFVFLWFFWYAAVRFWIHYVREVYISKLKWTLLQIQLPKDVYKSPLAMEVILTNAFYQTSGLGTFYERFWLGLVRIWFSLEIVSIEGRVYFFIWTPSRLRREVESQIYAQYPQAEIHDVPDYTSNVPPYEKGNGWEVWGTEFGFRKSNVYPIKTYVDYGLDKTTGEDTEQERIDPITSQIELMGSIGKGEQIWYQIVIRAQQSEYLYHFFHGHHGYMEEAEHVIDELKEKYSKGSSHAVEDDEEEGKSPAGMTKGQREIIFSIERNLNKLPFDVGIRVLYIAKKENYHKYTSKGIELMLKSYESNTLNGFQRVNKTNYADDPWQDITGKVETKLKRDMLQKYKLRAFFYLRIRDTFSYGFLENFFPSQKPEIMVMSSEELATLYHFPGRVSETPTFRRLESRKSEPPHNLPM